MKNRSLNYTLFFLVLTLVVACKPDEYKITVKNAASNAIFDDVYVSSQFVADRIYPGDSATIKLKIRDDDEIPEGRLSFQLFSNNRFASITVKTPYQFNADKNMFILIDDSSEVLSP